MGFKAKRKAMFDLNGALEDEVTPLPGKEGAKIQPMEAPTTEAGGEDGEETRVVVEVHPLVAAEGEWTKIHELGLQQFNSGDLGEALITFKAAGDLIRRHKDLDKDATLLMCLGQSVFSGAGCVRAVEDQIAAMLEEGEEAPSRPSWALPVGMSSLPTPGPSTSMASSFPTAEESALFQEGEDDDDDDDDESGDDSEVDWGMMALPGDIDVPSRPTNPLMLNMYDESISHFARAVASNGDLGEAYLRQGIAMMEKAAYSRLTTKLSDFQESDRIETVVEEAVKLFDAAFIAAGSHDSPCGDTTMRLPCAAALAEYAESLDLAERVLFLQLAQAQCQIAGQTNQPAERAEALLRWGEYLIQEANTRIDGVELTLEEEDEEDEECGEGEEGEKKERERETSATSLDPLLMMEVSAALGAIRRAAAGSRLAVNISSLSLDEEGNQSMSDGERAEILAGAGRAALLHADICVKFPQLLSEAEVRGAVTDAEREECAVALGKDAEDIEEEDLPLRLPGNTATGYVEGVMREALMYLDESIALVANPDLQQLADILKEDVTAAHKQLEVDLGYKIDKVTGEKIDEEKKA